MKVRVIPYVVCILVFVLGSIVGARSAVRYHCSNSIRLQLNDDKSVNMRAYDTSGKIIVEREQSLDDPISTLWDY